jgi:class 3 adenylate cyclase
VNVASRLEATGLPDRIQVSAIVVERLGDRFAFEPRGTTEIKGVGAMETFFLTGRKSA